MDDLQIEEIAKYVHFLMKTKKPIAWYWGWENETEDTKKLFQEKTKHIIAKVLEKRNTPELMEKAKEGLND